jgi:hypothetical protein
MMLLEVSLVSKCYLNCSYCAQSALAKAYFGPTLMSFDTYKKVLANCRVGCTVSFAGFAEPYLNRECSAMIAHTVTTGHPLWLFTTGFGMSDADVDFLISLGSFRLVIHLPDADGEMKAKVTQDYADRMSRLAHGVRGTEVLCYGNPHPMLGEVNKLIRKAGGLVSRAGNVKHLAQLNKRGPLYCNRSPQLEHPVVIPTGEAALCCCDWSLTRIIGNLAEHRWEEIYAGEPMRNARRAIASQDEPTLCRSCEFAMPA